MTGRELIQVLYENVTFPPATANKRMVRDCHFALVNPEWKPTARAEAYLWRIAFRFRAQIPKEVAEEAIRRKVDHQWTISHQTSSGTVYPKCSVCGNLMVSKREANAPCPGPPEPPKTIHVARNSGKTACGVHGATGAGPVNCKNCLRILNRDTQRRNTAEQGAVPAAEVSSEAPTLFT